MNPEYAHPVRMTLTFIQEHSDIIEHQVGARATTLVQNEQTHEIEDVVYEQNEIQKIAHAHMGVIMCCGGYYGAMTDEDIVDDGWAVQADTVEELAETIGVPADELAKTIDIWNEIAERGEGIQLYRLAEDMAPISEPPFYAIKCTPEFVNTDSGPVRSARAEILDLDGNPIPHLFSAGEFGSIWSNMYQGGGNLAECLIFGRIATRSALGVE